MSSKWTCSANEATCLCLAGAPPPCDTVFHPDFTYPIFGEAEVIYGYQRLHIRLSFTSGSLRPCLVVEYAAKHTTTSAKIDDVDAQLREFLPVDDLVAPDAWEEVTRTDHDTFQPHGTQVASYRQGGKGREREFGIFHATWDTPGFRAWHKRAQIFTLFFIEGASYLQDDEPYWEFFTLFERTGDAWHFVGYTSLYRFWCWPDKTRTRLSQFVILPPYQGQRHGSRLYGAVYAHILSNPRMCELTVEDPSEAFDKLRNTCDLAFLHQQSDVLAHCKAPIDPAWRQAARKQYKIAPRQWARLLDMLGLLQLEENASAEQLERYRLQVKARIYQVNREVLDMLPHEQKTEKLQEAFEAVMDEYAEVTGAEIPEALLHPRTQKRKAESEEDAYRPKRRL